MFPNYCLRQSGRCSFFCVALRGLLDCGMNWHQNIQLSTTPQAFVLEYERGLEIQKYDSTENRMEPLLSLHPYCYTIIGLCWLIHVRTYEYAKHTMLSLSRSSTAVSGHWCTIPCSRYNPLSPESLLCPLLFLFVQHAAVSTRGYPGDLGSVGLEPTWTIVDCSLYVPSLGNMGKTEDLRFESM